MPSRCLQRSSRILLISLLFLAGISGALSSTALAQSYVYGTGSFAVTGASPGAIVAADFNNDGKLDFAVANQNGTSPGTVSVLLGRPDGSFAPQVDYSLGSYPDSIPSCIAVGDFNGDGIPDLVVGLPTQPTIVILMGKGDGTFSAPISFQISSATSLSGVAVGDFNHDGKADLAVADDSGSDGMVTIFLGNGDGTFKPGVNYATGGSQSIIAADFNGDGNLDLAVGGAFSSSGEGVSVLLGNGDGTFKPYTSTPVPGTGSVAIAAGDLNGDGKLDLVAAVDTTAQGGIYVLLGNGDGTFQSPVFYSDPPLDMTTGSVAIGDFDGDGKLDVAAVNNDQNDVSIFKGNGDGTFQTPVDYGAGLSPEQVLVGDFNADGHADLAVAGGYINGSVTVLLNQGAGTFPNWTDYAVAVPPASDILTGDFNGDGNLDIATTGIGSPGSISVLLGNGDGTFQKPIETTVGASSSYMATGDFNRDGKLDLVVESSNPSTGVEQLSTLLGNGDGTFTDAFNVSLPNLANNIVVADFNNDGKLDVATLPQLNSDVFVFLGNGDGSFAAPIQVPIGANQDFDSYVFTADFNNDGNADLATSVSGGAISIILGNGNGTFQPATTVFPGYSLVAVGDFNGDGNTDLVLLSGATALYVALGNGNGTFQSPVLAASIPSTFQLVSPITGDFNGDGKLDLAFASPSPDIVSVLLGNGDGTFGNRIDFLTENSPSDPAAGDFTGNGSLDLAVPILQSSTSGNVSVYLNSPVAALNPAGLVYADQPLGTSSTAQNITLSNPGSAPLSIASISATSDFTETNTCGAKLASAANCQVSVKFAPTAGGLRKGELTLDDNAPGSPQTVALSGVGTLPTASVSPTSLSFSSVDVGSTSTAQTVTLSNSSSAVLTISGISTSGDFAQSNNCGGSLAAGANCTINVTFKPSTAGSRSGTLSIADDAGSSPQTVALSGTGIQPTVNVSPTSLSFSSQVVDTTSTAQTLTLSNSGSGALTIASISASGDFSQSNNCGASVAAGANCTINVTFKPSAAGSRSGTLSIADNASGSPQTVALSGTGTLPKVNVSPTSLTFPNEVVGATSKAQTITLTNSTGAALTISSISASGDFAQSNNCGGSVAIGAGCTINVTFTPSVGGNRSGTLSIADDAGSSPQTVALSGTGEDFSLGVASGSSSSDTLSPGGSAGYTLTLTPQGGFNQDVSFTCTGAPSEATCSVSPGSVTLDGSDAATVKVTATTTAASLLLPPEHPAPFSGPWAEALLLAALGLLGLALRLKLKPRARGRRLRWTMVAGLLLLVAGLAACGGGGGSFSPPSNPGTAAGTYQLKVTGTSGNVQHTTTLTLTVK